eukprot:8879577-Pyramimonas_sp.AAC.1
MRSWARVGGRAGTSPGAFFDLAATPPARPASARCPAARATLTVAARGSHVNLLLRQHPGADRPAGP